MVIRFESNADVLLGLIPRSELEPHQIAVTEKGDKLPTYQFLRAPLRSRSSNRTAMKVTSFG